MKRAALNSHKKLLTILVLCYIGHEAKAQSPEKNVREMAYLHLNTTLFLSGETMLFTGYCVSSGTHKLSALSRIMYVELLDSENQPVFQTKISLENGVGNGEYFINSLLATGQYTLVAYTRWMRNFNDFFYQPVTIINPFEAYTPPEKPGQVLASFHPEGGALIEGTANTVVCHVRNEYGNHLNLSGRLVNDQGEKILDFTSGKQGISRFVFTPEKGQKYQMILEDLAGNFHFFNLSSPVRGAYPCITKKGQQFVIETKSSPSLEGGKAVLALQDRQNRFLQKEVKLGVQYAFDQSDFPQGTLAAVLKTQEGEVLGKRLFYSDGENTPGLSKNQSTVYAKRQKVSLAYDVALNGTLSISVRKQDHPVGPARAGIGHFIEMIAGLQIKNIDSRHFPFDAPMELYDDLLIMSSFKTHSPYNEKNTVRLLPEHRHDLIEGYVSEQGSLPVTDKFVSFSLPGKSFQLAIGKTDESGRFVIPVNPANQDGTSFLKVLDGDAFAGDINLMPEFHQNYPAFFQQPLELDALSVADIVQKSIYNQVENAYFEVRPPAEVLPVKPFFTYFDYDRDFLPDDYTRFPTMREIFHEYIPLVTVSKNENDFRLNYRLVDLPQQFSKKDVLILLEGVPITKRQALTLDPYKIERIRLANKRYYLGPYIADGVISLHTYEGDLSGPELGKTAFEYDYTGVQPKKAYHDPDYTLSPKTRLPDKRQQLYWAPRVETQVAKPLRLAFFTSDITGDFEIAIEGISDEGQPVSIRERFRVR